jgi:hypothetical protein
MKKVNKTKTKSKLRSSFPENKDKDSVFSLRKKLIKSRKSGDDLAEALHVYMYVDNDSFGELDPAVKKLETAIDKYSRKEGWFPDSFKYEKGSLLKYKPRDAK